MNDHKPGSFEKRWQKIFQTFAQKHEHDAGIAGWTVSGLRARVRHFEYYFPEQGRGSGLWLDAGCGAGSYTRLLKCRDFQVAGLDYSLPSLVKARHKNGSGIAWLAGDVQALPFAQGTFTGALCFGVSQALSESDRLLREMTRVAESDAQLWVDGLNKWCLIHIISNIWRGIKKKPRHLRYESPYAMQGKLEKLGWKNVEILWLPIMPARLQWAQGILEKTWCRKLWQKLPLLGLITSHAFVLKAVRKKECRPRMKKFRQD